MDNVLNAPLDFTSIFNAFAQKYLLTVLHLTTTIYVVLDATLDMN